MRLRKDLGHKNVIATDIKFIKDNPVCENGIFTILDVMDYKYFLKLAKKYQIDTIIHLVALLSVKAEKNPMAAWKLNMTSFINALEVAKALKAQFFAPSSIAAYGSDAKLDNTPQDTVMHPTTIYGITKVTGELLTNYYYNKYGVDTRSIRFPGLVSYKTKPGGGTTDYVLDMYYHAILKGKYTCYIAKGTKMDIMYIDDAIDAIIQLMNTNSNRLKHRTAFNISAMSLAPEEVFAAINKYLPNFKISYKVNATLQAIADSWPNKIDDTCAREEWNFTHKFNLENMTQLMLQKLKEKLKQK